MLSLLSPRVSLVSLRRPLGLFGPILGATLAMCACGEANKQPLLPDSEHAEVGPDASAPLDPSSSSSSTPGSAPPPNAK